MVYTNVIQNVDDGNPISRDRDVNISVSCTYNRTARVGEGHIELDSWYVEAAESEVGKYDFALDFTDDSFTIPDPSGSITAVLNQEIYLRGSIGSDDSSLGMVVESCIATPSEDYGDAISTTIVDN